MSYRFSDGCTKTATVLDTWTSTGGGTQQYQASTGRFGGTGLMISGSSVNHTFGDTPNTMFTAFACAFEQIIQRIIWSCLDSASRQVFLRLEVTGVLSLVRGTTVLAATSQVFLANIQNHFEMKVFINGTTGTFELRLNGNTTPILTFTGNTQSTSNAFMNAIALENSGSGKVWFSDIHIWDAGGATHNTFLGNKRIYTQAPISDGGTNQFSTSPGQAASNHYLNVDEMPPNADTDYNFDNTVNHRESYGFAALPAGVQGITTIVAWSKIRIDDAGPHTYQVGTKSGGVDSFSLDINPGASYSYGKQSTPTDPNTTLAWTKAGVDAATLEVKITL
jgi:hypothetical protein